MTLAKAKKPVLHIHTEFKHDHDRPSSKAPVAGGRLLILGPKPEARHWRRPMLPAEPRPSGGSGKPEQSRRTLFLPVNFLDFSSNSAFDSCPHVCKCACVKESGKQITPNVEQQACVRHRSEIWKLKIKNQIDSRARFIPY